LSVLKYPCLWPQEKVKKEGKLLVNLLQHFIVDPGFKICATFHSSLELCAGHAPLWPFSKSKLNLKSDRVNLVAPPSPIEGLLYLPHVRAIQYKLGPERLTRLGNSNVLRLPVRESKVRVCSKSFIDLLNISRIKNALITFCPLDEKYQLFNFIFF